MTQRSSELATRVRWMQRGRCRTSFVALAPCLWAVHCIPPNVQTVVDFDGAALDHRKVLILPIAVTDDFGDERTGIVLDHQSREQATKLACGSAADLRKDIKIVCFDLPELAKSSALLRDLSLDYARDRAISAGRWHELAQQTGASFVLLFRPEGVSASQSVSKHDPHVVGVPGILPIPVPVPLGGGVGPHVDQVTTQRTYTLSSWLVDLGAGRIVRTGVDSASESTSTTEAPEASQHLHGIMRALLRGMLW